MSVQWAVLTVVGLAIVAVLGFRVRPPRARPVADGPPIGTVGLSRDLPEPVARYHRALGFDGYHVPAVDTFVLWGRARMRLVPLLRLPVRFWSAHRVGWNARQRLAVTWYGLPVLRAVDDYVDGRGRMRIGRRSVTGPEIDQGENLFLWAELLLVPAALAARPQARWQSIDAESAMLRVPFDRASDRLMVRFDPDTGLLTECRALRYRTPGGPKVGWYVWYERWTHGPGGWYPARISVRWADQPRPWFVLDVDGMAVNVPIDPDLKVGSPGRDTSDGPTASVPSTAALDVREPTGRGAR
jgi:hypothetical protein